MGELIAEHGIVVTISHEGYIKRVPLDTYREQGRGGRGISAGTRDEDFIEHLFASSSHDDLCFTDTGRVFKLKVWQVPEMSRTSRAGRSSISWAQGGERVVAF